MALTLLYWRPFFPSQEKAQKLSITFSPNPFHLFLSAALNFLFFPFPNRSKVAGSSSQVNPSGMYKALSLLRALKDQNE